MNSCPITSGYVNGPLARPDPVVGAAEPDGEDANHRLAGAGREIRHRLHAKIAGPVEDGGAHGAYRSRRLRAKLTWIIASRA